MNRPREIYPQAERDGGLTSRASQEPAPLGLVYEVRKSWGSGASCHPSQARYLGCDLEMATHFSIFA